MAPKGKTPAADHNYEYSPLTLSMETAGGISTPLIRRGTPLPANRNQTFSTAADNQKSVEINILLGERPLAKYNISIGKCLLDNITRAKSGEPQIRVIFDVDKSYNVKVEALEAKSGVKVEAAFQRSQIKLNDALVSKLLSDAQMHRTRDHAESTIAEANLRVKKDLLNNTVTSTTTRIEELISALGIALMEDSDSIPERTRQLRDLLKTSSDVSLPFGSGPFGNVFESFFGPTPSIKHQKPVIRQPVSQSQVQRRQESTTPVSTPPTQITALIQSFLEQISPDLEARRSGAWQALDSGTQDGPAQAAHSMREVLRQLLDSLAPDPDIQKAPWYHKPTTGAPVTRAMRIRYVITGPSQIESHSALNLIDALAQAVNSIYDRLSAQSKSAKRPKVSQVRIYLYACEVLMALIATERRP